MGTLLLAISITSAQGCGGSTPTGPTPLPTETRAPSPVQEPAPAEEQTPPPPVPVPLPTLATISLNTSDITGGKQRAEGTVTLTGPVPAEGMRVTLNTNKPIAAPLPAIVVIPPGASSARFEVISTKVTLDVDVVVSATLGELTRTAPLRVSRGSFISFTSQAGDYIGAGRSFEYTLDDGRFQATVEQYMSGVRVFMNALDYSWWWNLSLAAPTGGQLRPGVYENARRWPFQPLGQPGLDFSGDGRGCNTLTGRFTVTNVVYGSGPVLDQLDATFVQHCENASPALNGTIRIRADPWR